ncbi:TetR family transcriptional regulator C-terminal domain-containing protein, partial [Rhizobium johnstonii]|uniref:TetR family transcriptional regulator C-terminal domain-containing protein n=1 Tax=Rhizobium johnstonii TaxID=3019933 RepID=UPI003F9C6061
IEFVRRAGRVARLGRDKHELYARRYARAIDDLTAAFEKSVTAGFLRPELDYRAVARECVAVSDGLQLQWVIAGGELDLVGLTRAHLERLAPTILRSGERVALSVV